ncbi:MAG TPA: hypothetical protein V6D06_09960, partial [Trichocoleus sp.]
MLLKLLLLASAFTTASLVGTAFWFGGPVGQSSETLSPLASCAPTDPDGDDDDADQPSKPRYP